MLAKRVPSDADENGNDSVSESDFAPVAPIEFASLRSLLVPYYIPVECIQLARFSTLTVMPMHAISTGLTYRHIGLLGAVMSLGLTLGPVAAGQAITAVGPRNTFALTCVLAAASGACGLAADQLSPLPCFICAYFLLGVTDSVFFVARTTFLGATVPSDIRGSAASLVDGCAAIARLVGGACGTIAHHFSVEVVYRLQIVSCAVSMVATLSLMPAISASQGTETKTGNPDKRVSMRCVLRAYWWPLLMSLLFLGLLNILRRARDMFIIFEGHERNMSQAEVGRFASLCFFIDVLMSPVTGAMLDRLGSARNGAIAFAFMAVALLVVLTGCLGSFPAFVVIAGVASGLTNGLGGKVGGDMAPASCRGNFVSMQRMMAMSWDMLATPLLGVLSDDVSLAAAETLVGAFAVIGALCSPWCLCEVLATRLEPISAGGRELSPRSSEPLVA